MKNPITRFVFSLMLTVFITNQHTIAQSKTPAFLNPQSKGYADSVMNTLSRREKIAQLFMIPAWSGTDKANKQEVDSLIKNYKVGGLIFFQGGPMRQAQLYNYYQQQSQVPLLIGFDGEWGLSMRLDSTVRFPRQMTLGAIPNTSLIYQMGAEVARQFKLVGINVNFAPDIDINNNPSNPVINTRSFGEDREAVALKGGLYMEGMQDNGLLACAKHFPGHGNTDIDSHLGLPVINQSAQELDSMELYPFKKSISNGIGSVMIAHLNIPALDTTPDLPSTLSRPIVTDLLKTKMGFKGLVFTDALNMKGVASKYKTGNLEVLTLKAGSDILLMSENVPVTIDSIEQAMLSGFLDSTEVYASASKILQLKYWCGLSKNKTLDTTDLIGKLNNPAQLKWLTYQLFGDAITLLKNKSNTLPLKSFNENKMASLVINDTLSNVFQNALSDYAFIDLFRMDKEPSAQSFDAMMDQLSKYKTVILSIHNTTTKATLNYGITPQMNKAIELLSSKTKLVVVVFGNAYTLTKLPAAHDADALLLGYEDTNLPCFIAAQVVFGAHQPTGTLPVTPDSSYTLGEGLKKLNSSNVLSYTLPENYKIDGNKLNQIDTIALKAIADKATPGCQVLVAYRGGVIYNKSFGTYTYTDSTKVTNENLYDIASVTKIASTALATMYLYDKGDIDLNKKLGKYLPELKRSNKKDILLRDVLTHQAGLIAYTPFYKETLTDSNFCRKNIYSRIANDTMNVPVADSLFIANDYPAYLWKQIVQSEVKDTGNYVYSDFGAIIMQHIIEHIAEEKIDSLVFNTFYKPMGIQKLTFNPLNRFSKNEIVPTEYDSVFRKQLIQGYVHDPTAAMFGGVSGNAGLFSNAQGLAVLMEMFLQKGNYGGHQYLKKETVELFTKQYYKGSKNRRGLLFDKPEMDKSKSSPCAASASASTFGHQGFTGTCAWVDPDNELVYVFLSNRVNPTAENNKLAQQNIRTDIMQVVYKAIGK